MSYEIIKRISIRDNKVFLSAASNNVSPRNYSEWECTSLTAILQNDGQEALDLEILREYERGLFQRGENKYTRALAVLQSFPEYKDFDWRGENDDRRKSPAYKEILLRALNTKPPKDKYIIKRVDQPAYDYYFWKKAGRYAKFTIDKAKAKIFRFKREAESLKHCYSSGESWIVEQVQ